MAAKPPIIKIRGMPRQDTGRIISKNDKNHHRLFEATVDYNQRQHWIFRHKINIS